MFKAGILRRPRGWLDRVRIGLALAVTALSMLCIADYPGASLPWVAFALMAGAMTWSVLRARGGYFTLFLFVFLLLGCWAKLVALLLVGNPLVEPVGDFVGSPAQWDAAVLALTVAFAVLVAGDALLPGPGHSPMPGGAQLPGRFGRWLPACFVLVALAALAVLAFNFHHAILKIGTLPRLVLPGPLYALCSFMVSWGHVLLLGTCLMWMINQGRAGPQSLILLFGVCGALTAVSMGSRAQMVLYVMAVAALYLTQHRRMGWRIAPVRWGLIAVVLAALFVASLVLVSTDRLASFEQARLVAPAPRPPAAGPADPALSLAAPTAPTAPIAPSTPVSRPGAAREQQAQDLAPGQAAGSVMTAQARAAHRSGMVRQVAKLIVDRWVGLEGVLAVTAAVQAGQGGSALLRAGLVENPAAGVQAIYQRMARSQYPAYENFVFLTIPGPIAVLLYGGNLGVLAAGMLGLLAAGRFIEWITVRVVANEAASATVGMAMAYLVAQLLFPRTLYFFVIELLLFILGLGVLRWLFTGERFTAEGRPPRVSGPA